MREGRHAGEGGGFLASSGGGGADEDADVFAPVATVLPLAAGLVPEGAPLGGEVSVCSHRMSVRPKYLGCDNENLAGIYAEMYVRRPLGYGFHWSIQRTSGRDADQESIVFLEGLGGDDGVVGLGGCVHLGEDFFGEGLGDLVDVGFDAGLLQTSLLSLGHGLDVAVHGVL